MTQLRHLEEEDPSLSRRIRGILDWTEHGAARSRQDEV